MKRKIFFLSAFLFLNFTNLLASEVEEEKFEPAKEEITEKKKEIPNIEDRFSFKFEKLTRLEKGL